MRALAEKPWSDARLDSDPGLAPTIAATGTVPVILPGFSELRWVREAFPDCVAYGFFPERDMTLRDAAPLVHRADERIDVRT